MTAENFIQSFGSHRTGDKGYCRLATISTESDFTKYDIGFWFEILRNNGNAMLLTIQSDPCTKKQYRKTMLIHGVMQMRAFIEELRKKAQDDLHSFLLRPERYKGYIQLEPDKTEPMSLIQSA